VTKEKENSEKQQSERVPDLIRENKDRLSSQWLERVKKNPELLTVSLSDTERRDHVPDLLDEAIANACGDPLSEEDRSKAAEHHGRLRYHQGPRLRHRPQLAHSRYCQHIGHHFS
jgi:hypothetical protein